MHINAPNYTAVMSVGGNTKAANLQKVSIKAPRTPLQ